MHGLKLERFLRRSSSFGFGIGSKFQVMNFQDSCVRGVVDDRFRRCPGRRGCSNKVALPVPPLRIPVLGWSSSSRCRHHNGTLNFQTLVASWHHQLLAPKGPGFGKIVHDQDFVQGRSEPSSRGSTQYIVASCAGDSENSDVANRAKCGSTSVLVAPCNHRRQSPHISCTVLITSQH